MANETENNELKDVRFVCLFIYLDFTNLINLLYFWFFKTIYFDKIEGETNLVCVNEKSKVFLFDEDSESLDSEEMLNFVKRFVDG
jgi:hypothetical protein